MSSVSSLQVGSHLCSEGGFVQESCSQGEGTWCGNTSPSVLQSMSVKSPRVGVSCVGVGSYVNFGGGKLG